MYRSFLSAGLLAAALQAGAQSHVHQVVVLNEGYYDFVQGTQTIPVTLGSYDPVAGTYQTVATIEHARFASHVAVNEGHIYAAADSFLLKYDADTYVLEGQEVITGIRSFAFWNDQLVVTRGEVALPHYAEVRDKATLDLLYTVPLADLPYSCEDVEVVGDIAYLAVNNAFEWGNTVGMLGQLDLTTGAWLGGIDLGAEGLNPENVMVHGDAIYTLNNRDFTASSISKVQGVGGSEPAQFAFTQGITEDAGCGASELVSNGHIYFIEYAQERMARFNVDTDAVSDTLAVAIAPYGLVENPIDQVIYATTTDFVSTGQLHVLAYDGTVLGGTPVGVSAGSLALDVRTTTGMAEVAQEGLLLYPNPAVGEVFVRLPGARGDARVMLLDASGRVVRSGVLDQGTTHRFATDDLAPGLYTVRAESSAPVRFTKR